LNITTTVTTTVIPAKAWTHAELEWLSASPRARMLIMGHGGAAEDAPGRR
jgi:hypothetical protein